MKQRIARLALAGAVAFGVAAPLAPASASTCNPNFPGACESYELFCAHAPSVCRLFG
ncbi:MAG TPA: hypothetical protein VFQ85_10530 [Mycobacteriales bacterium]|jgi:hypothetical protein|nr:hypothetical protein [Mycobacteriales bacterium]